MAEQSPSQSARAQASVGADTVDICDRLPARPGAGYPSKARTIMETTDSKEQLREPGLYMERKAARCRLSPRIPYNAATERISGYPTNE